MAWRMSIHSVKGVLLVEIELVALLLPRALQTIMFSPTEVAPISSRRTLPLAGWILTRYLASELDR